MEHEQEGCLVEQPPNRLEVKGEEEYVVTLAEMLLALKQQLDRIELRVEIIAEITAPSKIIIRPGLED